MPIPKQHWMHPEMHAYLIPDWLIVDWLPGALILLVLGVYSTSTVTLSLGPSLSGNVQRKPAGGRRNWKSELELDALQHWAIGKQVNVELIKKCSFRNLCQSFHYQLHALATIC